MTLELVKPSAPTREEIDDLTLARARRGEADACRALVERYQRPVFAVLSRMLAGRSDAALVEDLAQETFLRVFRALPQFRPGGARPSTWILTIATRLAIDELRKRRPPTRALDDGELPAPERADAGARRSEVGRALSAALSELPEDMRAAFVLRAWHGLGHEEIARALEVEVGTVKSRIARAKKRLQGALSEVRG